MASEDSGHSRGDRDGKPKGLVWWESFLELAPAFTRIPWSTVSITIDWVLVTYQAPCQALERVRGWDRIHGKAKGQKQSQVQVTEAEPLGLAVRMGQPGERGQEGPELGAGFGVC